MAVRPGYKQTEVGEIPEDWNLAVLGEICTTSSGTTPARDLADRYFRNGTVNWVKTLDLNNSAVTVTDELVTSKAVEETCLRPYPPGTVLIAMYGGFNQIGRTGLLRITAAVNQAITAIQPRASVLNSEYLLATLNFKVEYWKAVASSSRKDPNITSQDIRAFPIAIPPPPEQRAIATALSDVDALLAKLDQFIAKKRDLKQAAMQQLLTGQTRLPGFSGDWEIRPLGSVIDGLEAGVSVNSSDDCQASDAPCILKTSAVVNGRFLPDECKVIMPNDIWRARLNPRRNTILVSRMNTPDLVGEVGYVEKDYPNLFIPDRLWMTRFRSEDEVSVQWMTYVLNSAEYKKQLKTVATGTSGSMKNISKNGLLSLHIPFPEIQEQTAIASVLSDMDAELTALEARRDKTRALKKGMMQELLTGRIRLV